MKLFAPFTEAQVAALNRWQGRDDVHPFTCQYLHGKATVPMIAYHDGWRCPGCHYRQYWAHDFMTGEER